MFSSAIVFGGGLLFYVLGLDIHIGKINMLGEIGEYEKQKIQIISAINFNQENKKRWLWRDGEKCDECAGYLQEDTQNRINRYIEIDTDKSYNYIKEISERMLKLFPNNIWWYNDLASVYFHNKDYQNAL
jgi:hypothetical protein